MTTTSTDDPTDLRSENGRLSAALEAALAGAEALAARLIEIEWAAGGHDDLPTCPACADSYEHAQGCWLDAALAGLTYYEILGPDGTPLGGCVGEYGKIEAARKAAPGTTFRQITRDEYSTKYRLPAAA